MPFKFINLHNLKHFGRIGGGSGNPYRAAGLEDRYTPPGEDKSGRALCQVREKVGAALRELGYPSRVQLVAWYKEWEAGKGSLAEALRCKALSLPRQIQSFTRREIGYPGCSQVLAGWIDELAPVECKTSVARSFSVGKRQPKRPDRARALLYR